MMAGFIASPAKQRSDFMTAYLVRLRFLQLYRSSGELGLFRVLLLAVVLLPLIIVFLIQRVSVSPWQIAIPAVALYIVWMVHSRRKDYHFLQSVLPGPQKVFLAEYLIFTLPVTALLLSATLYFHALVLFSIIILISLMVPSQKINVARTIKLKVIPSGMFEWQSGIRKNLFVVVLFYIPGLFGFYQLWLSAISLFVITLVFVSFYSEYEPRNMLTASGCPPWRFLMGKIARHIGFYALVLFPLLLMALVHEDVRLITAGYFLASLNLLAFSILLKYSQYRPGAYSGAHQLLTMLACVISVALPVALLFVVFNLLMAFRATMNLKLYLDDRN
jgi:hypothetical protein